VVWAVEGVPDSDCLVGEVNDRTQPVAVSGVDGDEQFLECEDIMCWSLSTSPV
jgi:hypothetical protein